MKTQGKVVKTRGEAVKTREKAVKIDGTCSLDNCSLTRARAVREGDAAVTHGVGIRHYLKGQ